MPSEDTVEESNERKICRFGGQTMNREDMKWGLSSRGGMWRIQYDQLSWVVGKDIEFKNLCG